MEFGAGVISGPFWVVETIRWDSSKKTRAHSTIQRGHLSSLSTRWSRGPALLRPGRLTSARPRHVSDPSALHPSLRFFLNGAKNQWRSPSHCFLFGRITNSHTGNIIAEQTKHFITESVISAILQPPVCYQCDSTSHYDVRSKRHESNNQCSTCRASGRHNQLLSAI